jgi:hypothetical protein
MNSLLANALLTIHQGKSGGRGMSPRLWARASGQMLSPDGASNAIFAADDFTNFGGFSPAISGTTTLPSATVPGVNGYGLYLDTATSACSIANVPAEVGGVIRLATGATDNHEAWLAGQGNTGTLGVISDTPANAKLMIFEARVRFTQVSNDGGAIFVGLAEPGTAANSAKVDDTGVMSDKDFIGFNTIQADGDLLSINYKKAGQTQQAVGSGTAIVAAKYYKLGFVYDPLDSKKIKFFIDNVELADGVSAANIAAATFPDGERLTFLAGIKNGAAAATSLDIDWWAFYQQAV